MDPLAGLGDVPWHDLTHAYGSADDVPVLLRRLQGDGRERDEARYALRGNIWHQGTTYDATAFAVPFLARLAAADASLAPELLFDLGAIAEGARTSTGLPSTTLARVSDRFLNPKSRSVHAGLSAWSSLGWWPPYAAD